MRARPRNFQAQQCLPKNLNKPRRLRILEFNTCKMTDNKNIIFSAAVRGSHVYKAIWKPIEGELLNCSHEKDNRKN